MTARRPGRRGAERAPKRLEDPIAKDRRAGSADRDERLYERKRAHLQQRRVRMERDRFDPSPPQDEDWTVDAEDTDGLVKLTPPTAVGDTLLNLVRRRGWDERLRGSTAWTHWEDIVGPDLAQRCEPVRLVRGTLTVRAENQVWATQLRYMLPHLRANAEAVLGSGTVREVTIVVGGLQGQRDGDADGSNGAPHDRGGCA